MQSIITDQRNDDDNDNESEISTIDYPFETRHRINATSIINRVRSEQAWEHDGARSIGSHGFSKEEIQVKAGTC